MYVYLLYIGILSGLLMGFKKENNKRVQMTALVTATLIVSCILQSCAMADNCKLFKNFRFTC